MKQSWSADEVEACLDLVRTYGAEAFARHAKATGRKVEAVRMHLQREHRERWQEAMQLYKLAAVERASKLASPISEQKLVQIDDFWDRFRPVTVSPPPKRSMKSAEAGVTVVASDFHFPLQDEMAVGIFLETIRQLKPERVILNGDLPDLLALSRYPKDVRHTWGLAAEAEAYSAFLYQLEEVLPKDARLYEIDANHSGNGTESRWWRYLSERIPELLQHPRAKAEMTYQRWWHPDWSRIEMLPEMVLHDDLLITHGDMARKWGGYTAKAHSERYVNSVMHGHTHRMGSHVRRVPAVGSRQEQVIRAYEIGCMCQLDPSYTSVPDWAQGFAIVMGDEATYAVELVSITNGAAAVAALHTTLRG
jgi:hypothetical protein